MFSHRKRVDVQVCCFVILQFIGEVPSGSGHGAYKGRHYISRYQNKLVTILRFT